MFAHDGVLIGTLKNNAELKALVGQKIYPDRVRQRSLIPHISYTMAGGDPYYHHGGRVTKLRRDIIHFFAISANDRQALKIAGTLLKVLESFIGTSLTLGDESAYIEFVKLLDEFDGGEYDPKDGSDNYAFFRRVVVEFVWSEEV